MDKKALLLSKKTSDDLVILGSGYSINKIKNWSLIEKVNSIGFNWFCKHSFIPNFYLIREQANIRSRIARDENSDIFIKTLNSKKYRNTFFIILDVSKHSPKAIKYKPKQFISESVVLRDKKKRKICKVEYCNKDIFEWGLFHGKCTLISVIHLAVFCNYKNIYFAGIDLNDSRYFWLKYNQTRHTIKRKRRSYKQAHPISKYVLKFLGRLQRRHRKINMYTMNRKSSLLRIMPYKVL